MMNIPPQRTLLSSSGGVLIFLLVVGLMTTGWWSQARADGSRRPCAGAGRWFPADPLELRRMVSEYLGAAKAPAPPGRVVAVIVPHAGYVYSGPTAGESFRALQRHGAIERVIILAFSHSHSFSGISLLDVEAYETPLGDIPVDRELAALLLKDPLFQSVARAHRTEHSDENQLPFLQVALGKPFKMVSLLVGEMSLKDFERAGALLRAQLDDKTVFVVSSDFTHYGKAYGFAPFERGDTKKQMYALDRGAIDRICARDLQGFRDYLRDTGATICGYQPISLLIKTLPDGATGTLLSYQTSADVAGGGYAMAVGYAAIAFSIPEKWSEPSRAADAASTPTAPAAPAPPPPSPAAKGKSPAPPARNPEGPATSLEMLDLVTPDEQQTLLRLARATLAHAFSERRKEPLDLGPFTITENLRKNYGVFVTLKRDGELRGCIGHIVGREPLYKGVMDNARNAAFHDPRFSALDASELSKVDIEISVLSPLEPTLPEDVVVGRDGLVISSGGYSGVLLPQVPVEWHWTRTEFLEHLCRKAGLPKTAWRQADLERFGAQVFGEKD